LFAVTNDRGNRPLILGGLLIDFISLHFYRRCLVVRVLFAVLAFASCGVVQAAPLIHFTLEGRKQGSNDEFASSVQVAPGDAVEYRLQMSMAPEGTPSLHLNGLDNSPTYKHGVNSLSISMFQSPTDSIQVDFSSPAELWPGEVALNNGWNHGPSARGGNLAPRPGSPWNDLLDIRPIHRPGLFTGEDDQTIYTGVLRITGISGDSGQIQPKWGPFSGAARHFGEGVIMTRQNGYFLDGSIYVGTEVGPDPITHFAPLTLTRIGAAAVPEPSTFALAGVTLLLVLGAGVRRSRVRGAM
jgi:hypothetical protein